MPEAYANRLCFLSDRRFGPFHRLRDRDTQRSPGPALQADRHPLRPPRLQCVLSRLGFAREIQAKPGTPLWRRDETGRSFALKLTAAGLKAIAVDEEPQNVTKPAEA